MTTDRLVPAEYGMVAGVSALSFLLQGPWMSYFIIAARQKYNVLFPKLYATADNSPDLSQKDRDKYNHVQRAHQSFLEQNAAFLTLLMLGGLRCELQLVPVLKPVSWHPRVASLSGLAYLLGRLMSFQRVIQYNLYNTVGTKGKLWNSVLRKGTVITIIGFYALLMTNAKWTQHVWQVLEQGRQGWGDLLDMAHVTVHHWVMYVINAHPNPNRRP